MFLGLRYFYDLLFFATYSALTSLYVPTCLTARINYLDSLSFIYSLQSEL